MMKFFKMAMGLALIFVVSGTAWSAGPDQKRAKNPPKTHHNPHKPGIASNSQPGDHESLHKAKTGNN